MHLLGIDLAWSENNSSALAFGELHYSNLKLTKIVYQKINGGHIKNILQSKSEIMGVAIDAPLIINNHYSARSCEKLITKKYGKYDAGCYPMNLGNKLAKNLLKISESIENLGFKHLNQSGKWMIEVYPHPAMIEIFELDKIIKYKKGNVGEKKNGQVLLAEKIKSLADSNCVSFDPKIGGDCLNSDKILSLKGKYLKKNEDILDAIVCLYIAALYQLDPAPNDNVYGDIANGYTYVPKGK